MADAADSADEAIAAAQAAIEAAARRAAARDAPWDGEGWMRRRERGSRSGSSSFARGPTRRFPFLSSGYCGLLQACDDDGWGDAAPADARGARESRERRLAHSRAGGNRPHPSLPTPPLARSSVDVDTIDYATLGADVAAAAAAALRCAYGGAAALSRAAAEEERGGALDLAGDAETSAQPVGQATPPPAPHPPPARPPSAADEAPPDAAAAAPSSDAAAADFDAAVAALAAGDLPTAVDALRRAAAACPPGRPKAARRIARYLAAVQERLGEGA